MNSDLINIKNGNRNPLPNVSQAIDELNECTKNLSGESASVKWRLGKDEMGPCLHASINFLNVNDCFNFAKSVYHLQEQVDHHSNFVIDNFLKVDIKLSTHQPVPAITHVDLLFAKQIMTFV